MELFKPVIVIAAIVLAVIGIAYVISILPQPIIWAAVILMLGAFVCIGRAHQ